MASRYWKGPREYCLQPGSSAHRGGAAQPRSDSPVVDPIFASATSLRRFRGRGSNFQVEARGENGNGNRIPGKGKTIARRGKRDPPKVSGKIPAPHQFEILGVRSGALDSSWTGRRRAKQCYRGRALGHLWGTSKHDPHMFLQENVMFRLVSGRGRGN